MRKAIPIITLLKELKVVLPLEEEAPEVHYTIFENNNSCIELVKCPNMRPRTKHIGLKYHYFRSKVKEDLIIVKYISTDDQLAGLLTKSLAEVRFLKLWKLINGW